ncbi:MAG: peptidyl-prolyl cis-trans isomerase [bacterium]|nr:peptidyl-prolyl cis-trans isomerase [bacterium]
MPTPKMSRLALLVLLPLFSCTAEPASPDAGGGGGGGAAAPAGPRPEEPVAAMNYDTQKLLARPRVSDAAITVEHVLVAFQGAKRADGVKRTRAEAEKLTAEIYAQALGGKKFTTLRHKYSSDPGGGVYPMKAGSSGMVAGFDEMGFRLQVDEIGVAPYHDADSPFGWHVIKRIK